MTSRESLISAILANPGDLLTRHALADCLEEEGEPDRAQLVRIYPALLTEPLGPQSVGPQPASYKYMLPENLKPVVDSSPEEWYDPIRMVDRLPGEWWRGGKCAWLSLWAQRHRFNGMFAVALSHAWQRHCGSPLTSANAAHELYLCGVIGHNRRNLVLGCGIMGCSPIYHHSHPMRRMAGHNYNRNVYELFFWRGVRMRPTRHGTVNGMALAIRDRLIASRWWEPAMRLSLALRRSREPRHRSRRRK